MMKIKRLLSSLLCFTIVIASLSTLSIPTKAAVTINSKISANSQVLVLRSDGRLFGWGDNSYGQLGIAEQVMPDGSYGSTKFAVYDPIEITWFRNNQPDRTIVDIYTAQNTSYIKLDDGSLWSAGDNSKGQCGVGTSVNKYSSWVKVTNTGTDSFKVGRVWCKYDVTFYENTVNNSLYVIGSNENGKCGIGSTTNRISPQGISSTTNFTTSIYDIYLSKVSTHIVLNNRTIFHAGYVGSVSYSYINGYRGYTTTSSVPVMTGLEKHIAYGQSGYSDYEPGYKPTSDLHSSSIGYPSPLNSLYCLYSFQSLVGVTYYRVSGYYSTANGASGYNVPFTTFLCHTGTSTYDVENDSGNYTTSGGWSTPSNNSKIVTSWDNGESSKGDGRDYYTYAYPMMLASFAMTTNTDWTGDRLIYSKGNDVYSSGLSNSKGQLGTSVTTPSELIHIPHTSFNNARAAKGSTVTINKLVSFDEVNYMLLNDAKKTLFSNGSNEFGQLGINKTPSEMSSTSGAYEITTLTGKGVTDIQSDGYSAIALCGNGDIYTWGNNSLGTCAAQASASYLTIPTKISTFQFVANEPIPPAPTNLKCPSFVYTGETIPISWTAPVGYNVFEVEVRRDNGGWTTLQTVSNKTSIEVDPGSTQIIQLRVATLSDSGLYSTYLTTPNYTIKDPPAAPSAIRVQPTLVKPGEEITVDWGTPGTGGVYKLQRSIDGGYWSDWTTSTTNKVTDTADEFWSSVKYRVQWQPNTAEERTSVWKESVEAIISQPLMKIDMIRSPSSIKAGDDYTISWDKPSAIGRFYYKIDQSIDGSEFFTIQSKYDDTTFTSTADTAWKRIQFKIYTTNGYEDSEPAVSSLITVINGGQTGQDDDDDSGGNNGGGNGSYIPLEPEKDGIAVSTSAVITRLKSTIYGIDGITENGKYKSYENLKSSGYEGYTEGLMLPVTYKSTVLNKTVTAHLTFDGHEYPVHWGDFVGPTEVQNLSGTVLGYVFVPKADMSRDDPAIACELYVQDSDSPGVSGTPRVAYREAFTVGVDMGEP